MSDNSLYHKASLHGKANIHFPNICSSHHPVNCPPLFDVSDPSPLLTSGWYTHLNCLSGREPSIFGVPICTKLSFSPVRLSSVNLIIRPSKQIRGREKKFSSTTSKINLMNRKAPGKCVFQMIQINIKVLIII